MCVFLVLSSQIWCTGDLLHTFQTSGLFDDSKTFVDMNLKADQGRSDAMKEMFEGKFNEFNILKTLAADRSEHII